MYIRKLTITNIRAIERFEMTFPDNPAGWHVIIGDNGAGKSTIVKAIALALIGEKDFVATQDSLEKWLPDADATAEVEALLIRHDSLDGHTGKQGKVKGDVIARLSFGYAQEEGENTARYLKITPYTRQRSALTHNWSSANGWFSCGFGPFRRFTGGNKDHSRTYVSTPRAGAHLTLFQEDAALTEIFEWLRDLDYRRRVAIDYSSPQSDSGEGQLVASVRDFINGSGLLPHATHFDRMTPDGPIFQDAAGRFLPVTLLSDGFRSILSLTFELIRQLVRVYGPMSVFPGAGPHTVINLPGVVLIDEIDAHLHPTWQTRIGEWCTTCFPQMQFIVTTHSPLVCRAAEKGTIWRLAAPGSGGTSAEVTGLEKRRLIVGNILDAYGTDLFGSDVSRSVHSTALLQEMSQLNVRSMMGEITDTESNRLQTLRAEMPTSL